MQERRKLSLRLIVAVVVPFVALVAPDWDTRSEVASVAQTLGAWLIVLCIVGRVWCALYIGGRKSVELVELGPYSVSRNPLYLFSFAGAIGVGLRTGSLTVAAGLFVAAIAVLIPVVRIEERVMQRSFAAAFEAYCAKVPRFWPRFSLWRDAPTLSLEPRHLYRVLGDSLFFASAIPLVDAVAWLHGQGILPVLLKLP